jgi:hypothetical protein
MGGPNPRGTPDAGGGFALGGARGRVKGMPNKDKPFKAMLKKLLLSHGSNPKTLEKIAQMVIDKACEGDLDAVREIANRLDGYPVRPVANEGDIPMFLRVSWLHEPERELSSDEGPILIEQAGAGDDEADGSDAGNGRAE